MFQMTFQKSDIERVERLARLNLQDENLVLFIERLSKVFSWIDQLKEVDVEGVEPLINPIMNLVSHTPLREDKIDKSNTETDVLSNAPSAEYNYFLVPKVIE